MLDLKPFLNSIYQKYNHADFISSDPIDIPHQFTKKEDIEASAFVAAIFSYGNVKQIQKTLRSIFANFSETAFVDDLMKISETELKMRLRNSYYRFYKTDDILVLFMFLKYVYNHHGNIENAALGRDSMPQNNYHYFTNLTQCWLAFVSNYETTNGLKFMVSDFNKKSANKRIMMYFRWMVRHDEIDFGVWNRIKPQDLIFPLDTHTSRILYYLGISETGKANLSEAINVTEKLRKIDSADPVRFDFSISRLGILNECPKRKNIEKCATCKLFDVCQR